MSRNPEALLEKEKCQEKLIQMEKYLPFLDYMIDKIQKKSKETSWECPLNKFQNLRSMIAEKSRKHNWEAIIKVEEVIQKLMVKINYKDEQSKESGECLTSPKSSEFLPDSVEGTNSMDSSGSIVSFSTTRESHVTSVDSRPHDSLTNTIDLVKNALKMSVENSVKNNTSEESDKESGGKVLGPKETWDDPFGTDLDKDLDGFDLTDGFVLTSGTNERKSETESTVEVPKTVSSHQDLLSTSRMKLMMSLGKVLGTPIVDRTLSQTITGNNTSRDKTSDSQIISAFGSGSDKPVIESAKERTQSNRDSIESTKCKAVDIGSDILKANINASASASSNEKPVSVPTPLPKSFSESSGKVLKPSSCAFNKSLSSIYEKQQTVRERLSADIGEIHRVPGKSVGGSLRSLKYVTDMKKTGSLEEAELFKPDKISHSGPSSSVTFSKSKEKSYEKCVKLRIEDELQKNTSKKQKEKDPNVPKHMLSSKTGISLPSQERDQEPNRNTNVNTSGKNAENKEKLTDDTKSITDGNVAKENMTTKSKTSPKQPTDAKKSSRKSSDQVPQSGSTCTSDISVSVAKNGKEFENYKYGKSSIVDVKKHTVIKDRLSTESTTMKAVESGINIRSGNISPDEVTVRQGKSSKSDKISINSPFISSGTNDAEHGQKFTEETSKHPCVKKSKQSSGVKGKSENHKPEIASKKTEETLVSPLATKKKTVPVIENKSENPKPENLDPRKKRPVTVSVNKSGVKTEHSTNSSTNALNQYLNIACTSKHGGNDLSRQSLGLEKPGSKLGSSSNKVPGPKVNTLLPQNQLMNSGGVNRNTCVPDKKHLDGTKVKSGLGNGYSNSPQLQSNLSEAKSYAEYKKIKKMNEERKKYLESVEHKKEESSVDPSNLTAVQPSTSDGSRTEPKNLPTKDQTSWFPKRKEDQVVALEKNSQADKQKQQNSDPNKSNQAVKERPHKIVKSENESKITKTVGNGKKKIQESKKRIQSEKRVSIDTEKALSPLGSLYERESPPKLGRGYGLQNFKIPKKTSTNNDALGIKNNDGKEQENLTRDEIKRKSDDLSNKIVLKSVENEEGPKNVDCKTSPNAGKGSDSNDDSKNNENFVSNEGLKTETEVPVASTSGVIDVSADKTANVTQQESNSGLNLTIGTETEKINAVKEVKLFNEEAKVPPSSESSDAKSKTLDTGETGTTVTVDQNDKTAIVKEEITQELVEALIRKSFQSGEGKLLLAQAKLFEKLARKLNSEKLKTIQKIINSESDSSSLSSFSESDSENEKKKKKKKKLDKISRARKKKKKFRKIRKIESSSEESCDEKIENEKENGEAPIKEDSKATKAVEGMKLNEIPESGENNKVEEVVAENVDLKDSTTTGKESSEVNLRKCVSNRKNLRKQGQKILLEQILNEKVETEPDSRPSSRNSDDKEHRAKGKKTKVKTELDRLHDDIRNMFICSGVVTATGVRMCRMLKESNGSMNDLDIVKESAKMVKEQKLEVLEQRTRRPRSRVSNNVQEEFRNSPSISIENVKIEQTNSPYSSTPARSGPIVSAKNFKKQPCVLLHKLDFNTWDYGVNVSKSDIALCMGDKSNSTLEGKPRKKKLPYSSVLQFHRPLNNVFLARNIRKCQQALTFKNTKSSRKGLLDKILKKLPFKKVDKINKNSNAGFKASQKPLMKKNEVHGQELPREQLFKYAFERNKTKYKCLLCTVETKNIVAHYKSSHQESEVLISRLGPKEARSAIKASRKNNYATTSRPQGNFKMKTHRKFKRCLLYRCRFCSWAKSTNYYLFFMHVVGRHTGERRHRCPAKHCIYSTNSRKLFKQHMQRVHTSAKLDVFRNGSGWCPVPDQSRRLFGYICSRCHYVQISLNSLKTHVKQKHPSLKKVKIHKINMSSEEKDVEPKDQTAKVLGNTAKQRIKNSGLAKSRQNAKRLGKRKLDDVPGWLPLTKKARRSRNEVLEIPDEKPGSIGYGTELSKIEPCETVEDMDDSLNDSVVLEDMVEPNKDEISSMPESILLENCVDLESNNVKKEMSSTVVPTANEKPGTGLGRPIRKLKVGPLEAQILDNSVVLYECFVKGCLFSTKVFDLFEKHVKISHAKTKWNGICKVCYKKNGSQVHLTSYKLIYALNHLKHHEKDNEPVTIKYYSHLKLKSIKKEPVVQNKASDDVSVPGNDSSFPRVPLLRVRNLVGDRLSTPKETGNSLVINSDASTVRVEEDRVGSGIGSAAAVCLNEDAPAMFTIENVRSLKTGERPEESDGQVVDLISHSCSKENAKRDNVKETVQKPTVWSTCSIPVLPCPTRTIAIRPDCSTLQVDLGQVKVVQSTSVSPVVLSPLATPVRTLAALATPQPVSKFTVQPVMVSVTPPFLNTSKTVSVMVPVSASTTTTTTTSSNSTLIQPEDSSTEEQTKTANEAVPRAIEYTATTGSSTFPEMTISFSDQSKKNDKNNRSRTKVYRTSLDGTASSSEVDESDEGKPKLSSPLQRLSTPGLGVKSVKDTKIYEEMLTKTKLCHLFKCMAIECSFTCNKESVFTQHIGLHEAQRRMKKKTSEKSKNDGVDPKLRKNMNWYQCAYCCEVLTNTSFALSRHIIIEHGHCVYQCAYCFYRAVSQNYVEIHQNLAHAAILKTDSRIIYKCQPLSRAPPAATALEKHGKRQSVRPYHCDQCGAKFFITQEFMNHLTTEHQSVTAYTCHICKNLCFKASRLINHYKLHSYCTYQCAYCLHGTETEKEMVFHLCNFHFSQPAYMYVRALSENQKLYSNQLDSLKVIAYENDNLSQDCIVEADPDEDLQDDSLRIEESADISAIAAELGISIEPSSSVDGEKSATDSVSVSKDNEGSRSDGSRLASQSRRASAEEGDMCSVPLGQLSLEVISAGTYREESDMVVAERENVALPDKNLKLNEILMNLQQHKDKPSYGPTMSVDVSENVTGNPEEKVTTTAFHKLPPVVLSRMTGPKNVYPPKVTPKGASSNRRAETSTEENDKSAEEIDVPMGRGNRSVDEESTSTSKNAVDVSEATALEKTDNTKGEKVAEGQARLQLAKIKSSVDQTDPSKDCTENSPNVSKQCPRLMLRKETRSEKAAVKKAEGDSNVLKPPIIRVEDFPLDDEAPNLSNRKGTDVQKTEDKVLPEPKTETSLNSPEVIILEEDKTDKILTVTIDSEDEKEPEEDGKSSEDAIKGDKPGKSIADDTTIRKEMEKLRNQIADETDCLLFDDLGSGVASGLPVEKDCKGPDKPAAILSPIEEAISSLNKKLEEEGEKKKREKSGEEVKKSEEIRSLPRTRSFTKERARRGDDVPEKSDSDDGNTTGSLPSSTNEPNKKDNKVFKAGLSGKDLYICGNDKCDFSADGDLKLKDHLFVCDLSRETTSLMCPHCFKPIKQFNTYIEHLKHHGEQKYSCGLCSFKSAVEMSVTRHVKQKHKCDQLKNVPKDPPQDGYLVYYPKNYKLEKQDFETNGYSPGDEDKLPLQAVYQVNVKCAKCPYFTKVRSNMVRHLKIHVKSAETEGVVIVPSTAPTNPVPCLDTKERMFDKMTNLAASSQLAQAKEKTAIEVLAPEDEAKLPQFVTEQMRYKCCLPDCNYITVDEGMLKHHIKALHAEITYYSCPHCSDTVHIDVRHVSLDKMGYHLKLHDGKLYKCPHCSYFHYQKAVVEKHTLEKHPERRYYVHTVREPKPEPVVAEEPPVAEIHSKAWKCGLCEDCQSVSKVSVVEHVAKVHGTKSKYKCRLCDMKSNHYHAFFAHFASKHVGEKVGYVRTIVQVASSSSDFSPGRSDSSNEHFDTTPLWQRGAPRVRHIRGILIEEEEVKTKKNKKPSEETEAEPEEAESVSSGNSFHCPICKKKFCTRNADFFRSHLYQELNYQQFACTLCGKMFVDKRDYEKHHVKTHPDKAQALKQTKEDGEIMFWVDKVIAKQKEEIESKKKRPVSENSSSDSESPLKKKRKND